MKNLALILALLLLATPVFADDGDIDKVEVKPDVASYALDTFKVLVFTQTAEVTYRKLDADGNSVEEEFDVTFTNTPDDPETIENEEDTSFTDFYTYLHTRIRALRVRVVLRLVIGISLCSPLSAVIVPVSFSVIV